MRDRDGTLLVAAGIAVLLMLSHEGRASNGLRPNAHGAKSLGRGGADIAWPGSALSMNSNPATIARIWDEQVEAAPTLLVLSASYTDAENPTQKSSAGPFPFGNIAYVTDFQKTEEEILDDLRETDPFYKLYHERPVDRSTPEPIHPAFGFGKILSLTLPVSTQRFPRSVSVVARGQTAEIFNLSVVANYYTKSPDRAYSSILASTGKRTKLTPQAETVATFENLLNVLPDPPDEIVLHYQLEVEFRSSGDSAEVRVVVDGSEAASRTTGYGDVQPTPMPERQEEPLPKFEHELYEAKRDYSPIKLGIGEFVQAGAGSDYKLRTEVYPEGVQHFSNFSFISLTPTVAANLTDWLAVGATLQLNYAKMELKTPVTQSADIMKGPLFPAGSLDTALGGTFGMPTQFGPAMKYGLDTSDTHAPGTSSTHVAKPNDVRFAEITGTADIKDATSFGFGGRFGLLFPVTKSLTFGVTYQTQSKMQNYKGKARIDFNNQITSFRANTTKGHSNEVKITQLGATVPTEFRFTFDQVWSQGVVDVYTFNTLTLPNFPLPNGSTLANLPDEGANGFASNYDFEIVDFQLPAELGFGVSYRLFDWLMLSVDVKRIFWASVMKDFKTVLKNGSNRDMNTLIGSTSMTIVIPQNWKDQNVIALGAEVDPFDWLTLRAGWNYGNNPIPADTVMPIVPGITEHHLSFGASVRVGSFTFDGAWMHALESTIRVSSSIQTRDLAGSQLSVTQDFLSLGITYDF